MSSLQGSCLAPEPHLGNPFADTLACTPRWISGDPSHKQPVPPAARPPPPAALPDRPQVTDRAQTGPDRGPLALDHSKETKSLFSENLDKQNARSLPCPPLLVYILMVTDPTPTPSP